MEEPNEFQPLMDEIFRQKVLRARAEKDPNILSLDGLDLFEFALEWTRDGIRNETPAASPAEIEAEVRRRIEIKRRLDERGIYSPVA